MGGERQNARLPQGKVDDFVLGGANDQFNFLETGFAHETGDWHGEASHMSLKGPLC